MKKSKKKNITDCNNCFGCFNNSLRWLVKFCY